MCILCVGDKNMDLQKYLETKEISLEKASNELGFPYESVRRYALGYVIPRPEKIKKITEWSNGEVTANDFINNYQEEKSND
jgi:hypothetical protein